MTEAERTKFLQCRGQSSEFDRAKERDLRRAERTKREREKRAEKIAPVKAPPTYAGLLCREILAENARARAAVDARKKGQKLW